MIKIQLRLLRIWTRILSPLDDSQNETRVAIGVRKEKLENGAFRFRVRPAYGQFRPDGEILIDVNERKASSESELASAGVEVTGFQQADYTSRLSQIARRDVQGNNYIPAWFYMQGIPRNN